MRTSKTNVEKGYTSKDNICFWMTKDIFIEKLHICFWKVEFQGR